MDQDLAYNWKMTAKGQIERTPGLKKLQSDEGFMIYFFETYNSCRPFMKGMHITLYYWCPHQDHKLRPLWVDLGITWSFGAWTNKYDCFTGQCYGYLYMCPTHYKSVEKWRGEHIYWYLMAWQGFLNNQGLDLDSDMWRRKKRVYMESIHHLRDVFCEKIDNLLVEA